MKTVDEQLGYPRRRPWESVHFAFEDDYSPFDGAGMSKSELEAELAKAIMERDALLQKKEGGWCKGQYSSSNNRKKCQSDINAQYEEKVILVNHIRSLIPNAPEVSATTATSTAASTSGSQVSAGLGKGSTGRKVLIGALVVGVIVGGYFLYKYVKK